MRSGSQKFLLVVSIIEIVCAVLLILVGFVSIAGTMGTAALTASDLAEAGISEADRGAVGLVFGIVAIVVIVMGLIGLLTGILGVRAANDNQKIMPVWVLAIIEIAFSVIAIIYSITQGSFGNDAISLILSLAVSVLMFWVANNIKVQAGK